MPRFILIMVLFLATACAPAGQSLREPVAGSSSDLEVENGGPSVPGGSVYRSEPLLWEKARREGLYWSAMAYQIIGAEDVAAKLLPGSNDIHEFCPRYAALDEKRRANFWAYLISAMAKYESGFNPTSRYTETTMGVDPVTGKQVVSEGLLQLSYQDVQGYTYCKFDWLKDKLLGLSDPKRTILDPYINLDCGIRILAGQVAKKGAIGLKSGVYWAVLKVGGKYSKLPEITRLTQALPFCKN